MLSQAAAPALSPKLRLLIVALWALVGGMVAFVVGAIWWRSSMTLTLTAQGLVYKRLLGAPQTLPDPDVEAVLVRRRGGRGLELVVDARARRRLRLPLSSARRDGQWRPMPDSADVRQHPLVAALIGRYGDRVLVEVKPPKAV
jgi:hypothetical protein